MRPLLIASLIAVGTAVVGLASYSAITRPAETETTTRESTTATDQETPVTEEAVPPPQTEVPENMVAEQTTPTPKPNGRTLSGTYRCWSYNVDGAPAKCSSSQFVFTDGGTYAFSSEKGTYKVSNNTVTLSGSKLRGAGILSENDLRLVFTYTYNGQEHTVTYLKR